MKRGLLRDALAVAALLVLPALGHAADASKFRYTASVYLDKDGRGMRGPEGVACNDDLSVAVADTGNGRVLRYTLDGEGFKGGEEVRLPERARPTRIQITSKGEIYCLDGRQRRLIRIGTDGSASYLELTGIPEPSAVVVWSFRMDQNEKLYVLDPVGRRVLIADSRGRYLGKVNVPAGTGSLDDIAVDPRGNVYLLDGVRGEIHTAPKDSETFSLLKKDLRQLLNFSADLTVDARGTIYLTDQNGGGIVVLGADGSFLGRHSSYGWKEGLVRYPAQICANGKGGVLVADRDNNRVQLFTAQ